MDKRVLVLGLCLVLAVGLIVTLTIAGTAVRAKKECNDKIDNDGDGYIDRADAGCSGPQDNDETNCGDGVCEGGETQESCPEDCGYPTTTTTTTILDSCSDTDGWDVETQGLVSGYQGGNPYNFTDYCNGTYVIEYYCSGTTPNSWLFNCEWNYTTCVNGACI